jgi:hypothetical protein
MRLIFRIFKNEVNYVKIKNNYVALKKNQAIFFKNFGGKILMKCWLKLLLETYLLTEKILKKTFYFTQNPFIIGQTIDFINGQKRRDPNS